MEIDVNKFWERLDEERNLKGFTYSQLENKLNYPYGKLRECKSNKRVLQTIDLMNVCDILDCSIDYIVTGRRAIGYGRYTELINKYSSSEYEVRFCIDKLLNLKS